MLNKVSFFPSFLRLSAYLLVHITFEISCLVLLILVSLTGLLYATRRLIQSGFTALLNAK